MTAADPTRKLTSTLKRLRTAYGALEREEWLAPLEPVEDPMVMQLLFSFLAWEAGTARAAHAIKKLLSSVVDINELRVCLPDETAGMLGERYPRAVERCVRLRTALNELYKREHAVTLKTVADLPKRDARTYLGSLEGMPGYVTGRMLLLALGGHAFPLDERMREALAGEGCLPGDLSMDEASAWLERQFRAGEAAPAYLLIEAWLNDDGGKRESAKAGSSRSARRRTSTSARPTRKRTHRPQP